MTEHRDDTGENNDTGENEWRRSDEVPGFLNGDPVDDHRPYAPAPYGDAVGPHQPVPPQPVPPPADASPSPGRLARRGPGWGGTVAMGVGAAVLASLLTVGGFAAFGGPTTDHTTPTTTSSASSTGTLSGASATVPGTTPNWVSVSAAVEPSVVSVRVDDGNGSGDEGSGVILNSQGDILTNNHVIADAATSPTTNGAANNGSTANGATITAALSDGRIYAANVVGTDTSTDLAVLKLVNAPSNLTPATFGNSSAVNVGEAVMAVGNPLGLSDTATTGIVSALNRPVTTTTEDQQQDQQQGQQQGQPGLGGITPGGITPGGITPGGITPGAITPGATQPQAEQVVTNAIQTDAAVNPGNSGGVLVDGAGQVIGITSSIASLDTSDSGQSGSIGLGFAIPSNEAKDVANQLLTTGTVRHAYLGVTIGDGTTTVNGAEQEAAVVGTVASGTPAATAGLQAKDAIIAVNGQPVDSADSLVGQIRALDPGAKVTLTLVRSGHTQTVTVTLGAAPSSTTG